MTQKHGKLVLLSTLILLFLAGGLVGAAQEENKEKKKEPVKSNETSTTTNRDAASIGVPFSINDFGKPTVEVAYINGKPQGKAIERYADGARTEGEYNNGLKTGLWIHYEKNGRKFTQESYKNGKEDGKFITWHESGYVDEIDFKDSLIDGKQCSWDKNGKLIFEAGFKAGKQHGRHISWYSNGNKQMEGYFNEGTGKLSIWYQSGKICIEKELKNGKQYGKEIWWYENGQKEREQTYNEEGKKIGKLTHWYENGKVAFEEEFDQNGQRLYKKDYDRDGNLTFDNDRPVDKKKTININSSVEIPPKFDLRAESKLTEVKNQLKTDWSNTCWAFAYTGALESHMKIPINPEPEPNYSEQHLADKNHGWDADGLKKGGNRFMALAYYNRNGGPIAETDMPYDPVNAKNKQISFQTLAQIREVQCDGYRPRWSYQAGGGAEEFCKKHIYTLYNGGVAGELYYNNSALNTDGKNYYWNSVLPYKDLNHGVVLVGWDNTYRKENFKVFNGHLPVCDGALIVKNSWGTGWGESGYFYISMDSEMFFPNTAFVYVAPPVWKYNYTYQYDLLGLVTYKNFPNSPDQPSECTYANVFTAENPTGTIDNLRAVGFYLPWVNNYWGTCGFNYTISVYTDLIGEIDPETGIITYNNPENGTIAVDHIKGKGGEAPDGWYSYGGYYTQDLPNPIPIKPGSRFSVVIKNSRDPYWQMCAYAVEKRVLAPDQNNLVTTLNASAKRGESFQLTPSGWKDLKDEYPGETLNACIKAFTDGNFDHYWKLKEALDDPTLNVSSDNGYNLNWTRVTDAHASGNNNDDSAKSSWINVGERCHMEVTVAGPTGISFYWAVSSDPGNSLKLYIDQDPKKPMAEWVAWKSIGGTLEHPTINWQQEQIYLPQGSHKLEWSYEKTVTATTTVGDCGWVDGFCKDVKFTVATPNGGEGWLLGTTQSITWDSGGITGNLRIQLLKDDVLIGLIAEVPATPGEYVWTVGSWQGGMVTPGPGYKIRILTAGGTSLKATLQSVK